MVIPRFMHGLFPWENPSMDDFFWVPAWLWKPPNQGLSENSWVWNLSFPIFQWLWMGLSVAPSVDTRECWIMAIQNRLQNSKISRSPVWYPGTREISGCQTIKQFQTHWSRFKSQRPPGQYFSCPWLSTAKRTTWSGRRHSNPPWEGSSAFKQTQSSSKSTFQFRFLDQFSTLDSNSLMWETICGILPFVCRCPKDGMCKACHPQFVICIQGGAPCSHLSWL